MGDVGGGHGGHSPGGDARQLRIWQEESCHCIYIYVFNDLI